MCAIFFVSLDKSSPYDKKKIEREWITLLSYETHDDES